MNNTRNEDESEMILHIKEFEPEMIYPSTKQMYDKDSWGAKTVVIGKPACFEMGTKILMYNGEIKNVEEVQVGDIVMGDDSTPRNVLSLSRGRDTMYKIIPKIGEPLVVNKHHILTIVKTKGNNKGQIIDIELNDFIKLSTKNKSTYNWIRVPVEFPKIYQKIDPYIIGFFIDGDYSFIKREFIKKHFNISDNIIDKLIEKNVPIIPQSILFSDIEDRAKYLAGMLDSKATYNSITKRFDIPLPSEELCEQVMYLAGSIGYYNSKIKNYKSNFFTQTQQAMWSCYIYVNTNTILPSKIFDINYIKTVFGGMFTTDFYINELNENDFYGFTVDGNKRFLLGDFSVTHNSGKCMGKDTPVLMYDGTIKLIQDIKVGDKIMGDDSNPKTVLEICNGIDDLYKICQHKGNSYVVNSNHILTLKIGNEIRDMCIQSLAANCITKCYGIKTKVKFPYKEVSQSPYIYGRLVMDNNELLDMNYIINDEWVRNECLAGILDANGKYNKNNHSYEIPNIYDKFYKNFQLLIYSLGYHITRNKHTLCSIYGPVELIPCRVHDTRCNVKRSNDVCKTRIKIKYIGKGQYYGFELDGNGRYLLNDCTITHNTYAIKSLLYAKRHIFPVGMVFSGTEHTSGQWGKIFPQSFVFNKLRLDKIQDFLHRQTLARKHLGNPWAVLLLDDCAYEGKLLKNELFKEIFQNGRHYKMWFILSLQYPADILPTLRTCIDYTFIFRENTNTTRKKIYENYASVIPSFSLFCAIMDEITNDYTALVINNLSTSNDLQDCIFWFKAPPYPEDFKFGSVDFWNHHYVRFNEESAN